MARTALAPVFVGLRTGLHVLFIALLGLVLVKGALVGSERGDAVAGLAGGLIALYVAGALVVRRSPRPRLLVGAWLAALTAGWAALLWLSPDAAYVAFPLFFLYLQLLPRPWSLLAVAVSTGAAVLALAGHTGWSVAGVVGPVVGAAVAVMVGLGYRTLAREALELERVNAELVTTRDQLAATEHEAGVLAERARLARDIHDTVAQGLSSIQLLLHAAERAGPAAPGVEHVRLARETAAASLADTRRFIRELQAPELDQEGLGTAIRRLAETVWRAQGLNVTVQGDDGSGLPMHLQTALLRIAQGAMANVVQHAGACTATVTLTADDATVRLDVADDGRGFDVDAQLAARTRHTDSFGLRSAQERVSQLGGTLRLTSSPGSGTTLTVEIPREDAR